MRQCAPLRYSRFPAGQMACEWSAATVNSEGSKSWGLVGFFNWNLVDAIFGGGANEDTSGLSRVIYAIVGLAGLAAIPLLKTFPKLRQPAGMPTSHR